MPVYTIVNSILQSCTYIIYDNSKKQAYLIDCGDAVPIITFLESQNKQLKGIFLTHCHYDHIYGLNEIIEKYPHTLIYGSKITLDGLSDIKTNLSKYNGFAYTYMRIDNLFVLSTELELMGLDIHLFVIPSPGHDSGCLSYIVQNNIFTGDAFIPNIPLIAGWPRSNKSDAKKTKLYLQTLIEKKKYKLYPGHKVHD